MVPELFDHIMDMIIKIYKNENGSKEGGDIVDKVRVYLIREIEEREVRMPHFLLLILLVSPLSNFSRCIVWPNMAGWMTCGFNCMPKEGENERLCAITV